MHSIPQSHKEISILLKSGELTCEKLVSQYLENIHEQEDLNVFISLFESEAIERSKEIDEKIKKGTAGKLAGLWICSHCFAKSKKQLGKYDRVLYPQKGKPCLFVCVNRQPSYTTGY